MEEDDEVDTVNGEEEDEVDNMEEEDDEAVHNHQVGLWKDHQFFDHRETSDLQVTVGTGERTRTFYLHRTFLCRAEYFRSLLSGTWNETQLQYRQEAPTIQIFADQDPDVCEHLFRYIYTSSPYQMNTKRDDILF